MYVFRDLWVKFSVLSARDPECQTLWYLIQIQLGPSVKMTSCQAATKPPTIFSIIKQILHFGLLIAFLAQSLLALLDFLTYETTYRISREERNISLPSFTLCGFDSANEGIFDKVKLAKGVIKDDETFPMPFTIRLLDEIEQQTLRIIDLKNSTDLQY